MSMVDKKVNAKSVEELVFVHIVDEKIHARNVEEVPFVSMVIKKVHANCVNYASIKSKQWTVQLVK